MDFSGKENDVEGCLPPGVFEILGEPAVVINRLPLISSNADTFLPSPVVTDTELHKIVGFGQWFEGREGVKYEDGDDEDLEWHELEEVLQPLDINIPLE
ncbi:hypothetical protein KY290_030905 [Solanum tuberosum]|uniref:PTM/DIR17-like Tudor domain-containing protein n=1 Tax=Solanum tuberosum TaxID=4113 RepID=A0ABQ7U7N2_SOLTU|nr:hypothetical protein KY285_029985 [Solanum tuberosum]KAH0742912.1 hypothetical protein KY290_030905 [Solanum tuberosum]